MFLACTSAIVKLGEKYVGLFAIWYNVARWFRGASEDTSIELQGVHRIFFVIGSVVHVAFRADKDAGAFHESASDPTMCYCYVFDRGEKVLPYGRPVPVHSSPRRRQSIPYPRPDIAQMSSAYYLNELCLASGGKIFDMA
ncbi:hypothetical protein KM043_002316 [Ampulex compressa]|nr:hypothetical protein KM043_002316 [Ampulex compressa]